MLRKNNSLRELNVWGSSLGDATVAVMDTALKQMRLTTLNVGTNKLFVVGSRSICAALKSRNIFLQSINLYCSKFDREGKRALAEMLKYDIMLHELFVEKDVD